MNDRRRILELTRFHGFLLVSAALIAAVVVAAGLAVGNFFERHVLTEEETQTVEVAQNQAQQHLTPKSFDAPVSAAAGEVFEEFLRGLPGVFRVKVFDPSGRIVWSNEPRLIGRSFPDNAHLRRALEGRVTTVIGAPTGSEHVYEWTKQYIAEVYVPITFAGSPAVGGVVETYKDVTEVVLAVQQTQRRIWLVASATGLFLYLSLAFVVWKASASERRAHQALLDAQAQLVEKERLAAVGEVVVGLHHAILNPLTGILGALQVLKDAGGAAPERARAVVDAEAEIRKIERLIKRLPDLRRAGGTPYVGKTTMLDLERCCGDDDAAPANRRDLG